MSDQNTTVTDQTATQTPNTEAGQASGTPNAGAQAAEPFRVFQSQAELDTFMAKSKRQAERKALNDQAKTLGYDSWDEMSEALQPLRRAGSAAPTTATPTPAPTTVGHPQEAPQTTPTPSDAPTGITEAQRLKMALSVASDLSLPTALVARLQGDTVDEMTADANRLLGLFQQPQRGPGIPPAPKQNQPVTFTRAQLQNAEFVRTHQAEIMQAAREGRIVDS